MEEAMVFMLYLLLIPVAFALYISPWWVRWLWPRVRYCFAKKQTSHAKVIDMQEKYPLYLRDGGWVKTWHFVSASMSVAIRFTPSRWRG